MLGGTFALLERSFRVDVRSRSSHLIRFGTMVAIYVCLCNALMTGVIFGAPGLRFFGSIIYLNLALLSLTGISFFATSITEEKEEDTLGLMLMAGISPLGILTGKSLSGLWQTILLIAIQFPFVLLSVTMGGVSRQQVWSATIALMAYVVLLAGLGVLCSTVAARSRAAVRLMCIAITAYIFVPAAASSYLIERTRQSVASGNLAATSDFSSKALEVISDFSIFLQIGRILSTGFDESAFGFQVVSNVIAGAILGGLSLLTFGRAVRNPSAEATSRELVGRRNKWSPFTADRVWENAFVWKDFHFVAGGVGMTLIRVALFIAIGLIPFVFEQFERTYGEWVFFSIALMLFAGAIAAASVLARSMYDEIRGQTLSSLLMLPTTPAHVVYSKYGGALLGWIPIVAAGPIALMTSEQFRKGLGEFIEAVFGRNRRGVSGDDFFIIVSAIVLYSMFFILIPHFAALLALYVRWGAVPLAIGLTIAVYFIGGACISSIALATMAGGSQTHIEVMLFLCDACLIGLCVGCHVNILLRVQQLAAK